MQNRWVPCNSWQCWSGGGAVWFVSINTAPIDTVTRCRGIWFGVGGSHLHCGPAVYSLKPHIIGDGEKNGNTPVSPPQTECPKSLCSDSPHIAARGQTFCFCFCVFVHSLPCHSGACLGFKPRCLKGSHSMHPNFGEVPLCPTNEGPPHSAAQA